MAIFYTRPGICRDCYKCVRHCPVKAIRVQVGQASVVEERCLGEGLCVRTCPRGAIRVRSGVGQVEEMLRSGARVVASVAPSFSGEWGRFEERLRERGFAAVAPAEEAAREISRRYRKLAEENPDTLLSSRCPAVVRLVEIYHPEVIRYLAPLTTLAVAHARILRARYGPEVRVVHFGSCTAARMEVGPEYGVDVVMSFAEAERWLSRPGRPALGLARRRPEPVPLQQVRGPWIRLCGVEECVRLLKALAAGECEPVHAKLWACAEGCPEGSLILEEDREPAGPEVTGAPLGRSFRPRPLKVPSPRPEEIEEVLHRIGIETPSDELNCGACGYDTCREKAAAVLQGMAEEEMCVPYIRRKAAHASAVIENTPNAVMLVDEQMRVRFANPAFFRMFHCQGQRAEGRPAAELLHTDLFERARAAGGWLSEKRTIPEHDVTYRAGVFPVGGDQNLLAAVIVDVTEEEKARIEFNRVKQTTLDRAQEVITRQMRTAQEIASLLGETTADTKALLVKLMELVRREEAG